MQYGRKERRLVKAECCLWNFLGEGDFPRKQWGMGKQYTGNEGNSIRSCKDQPVQRPCGG